MKLATLLTAEGVQIVAVEGTDDAPVFRPLNWVDLTLPKSLKEILATEHGLALCHAALLKCQSEKRVVTGTLLPPIPDPGKVICIGLNYRDHAIEAGMKIPEEPICFGKFGNTIIGSGGAIRLPRVSDQVDYEAELVIVIGKRAYGVSQEKALDYVAGYCNGNDVSARDWQINKPGKQWMLGKTPDTFAPIGPWVVTADEVDPNNLTIELRLNGNVMQSGNTHEFIFGVAHVVSYLSQLMTLEPGDVIFTGTPPGVGMGRTPPVWLKPGDVVEVEIQGLGVLRNPVIAPLPVETA
ncbi:fumarylacetoacetate hydrolase family protein [Planctomicrobium piriforme]|uniref:2-keto-4-pentenoate hydratase/2-oxohepta-3-ene-1,7-dioic acid hydratase (Catechol pathway) n=1 Tax=Planctomicrobium piriforme TaxID=1576369 RepID=A0A1I3JAL0_9PLAN|nr:fumarylacetoacetate hydrolase family protein [Planctomicrobium piriforme]SFI57294.1 2-keto-4-pentenoate hydratase/2-oxohepta-3-ene-1,7-dioic acid hydratase (catechol pathway) [Planctomicrobium piriforme]